MFNAFIISRYLIYKFTLITNSLKLVPIVTIRYMGKVPGGIFRNYIPVVYLLSIDPFVKLYL